MMTEHDYKNYPELTNSQLETLRFNSPHTQIENDFTATVIKVKDGDTVQLEWNERDFTFPMRFLDIDSKELGEGGEEAKAWLKDRIEGHTVTILINPINRVDKYGRLLGRVFHNGMDVGEEELRLGLATPFDSRNEGKLPDINKELSIKKWF